MNDKRTTGASKPSLAELIENKDERLISQQYKETDMGEKEQVSAFSKFGMFLWEHKNTLLEAGTIIYLAAKAAGWM